MKSTAICALPVFFICLLLQSCAVTGHIDTDYLPAAVTITASVAALVLLSKKLDRSGRWRHGSEHGSAAWGDVKELDSRLCVQGLANGIISKNLRYCLEDGKKSSHGRNANAVIIGGSGAGKSRYWAIPNIMLANANYVVTDPSGELYDACAEHLKRHGYRVLRFDLENISRSDKYNPFKYIRDDNDVIALIETLVKSTTPKDARTGDIFWTKAESALLQALMFFLYHESPECDQNFGTVLKVLRHNEVRENSDRFRSRMDRMFDELTAEDPDSIAGKQYAIYKSSAG